ncbi:response regulator, partial [Azoarcus communis]|uniref:response regulator n=1 Tax=Parazoarcus communis TaxID=41977 RepID=UPI00145991D6
VEVEVEGADPAPIVKGLKILVAEDNPTNRMLIQAMLARKGHCLEMAEDGQAAFERASEADYDVVLMDIQMPRMDGYQAASAIRALPGARARVPIVALTADALLEERDKALQSGLFQHYLTKPIDWALLDATLARFKPV